jgi:hypothetical protein
MDTEHDASRPNDALRTALRDLLDLADRAGVALTYVTASHHADVSERVGMTVQGDSGANGLCMTLSDALRIALRCPGRQRPQRLEPTAACPHTSVMVDVRDDAELTIICEPTWAQVQVEDERTRLATALLVAE